jgi:hypothetical protein
VKELKSKPHQLSWRSEKLTCLTRNMACAFVLSCSAQQPEFSQTCPGFCVYKTTVIKMMMWHAFKPPSHRRIMQCAFTDVEFSRNHAFILTVDLRGLNTNLCLINVFSRLSERPGYLPFQAHPVPFSRLTHCTMVFQLSAKLPYTYRKIWQHV